MSEAFERQPIRQFELSRKAQKLDISLAGSVKAETVHAALDRIFEMAGCRACGLVGIDLTFRGDDPILERFADLEGIRSIEVGR